MPPATDQRDQQKIIAEREDEKRGIADPEEKQAERAQVEKIKSARVRNVTARTSNGGSEPELASDYQKLHWLNLFQRPYLYVDRTAAV
jgi:hypothetical protein